MTAPRIPSLNWLRVFDAAAQMQSFSAAARLLNVSSSAVSQQIGALEHFLGTPLFERHARSVTLTSAGRKLLPTVQATLGALESSVASIFPDPKRQVVTVEANTMLATSWLAPRIPDFLDAVPSVDLQITGADRDVAQGRAEADVTIRFGATDRHPAKGLYLFGETILPVAVPELAARITQAQDLLEHALIDIPGHLMTWPYILASLGVEEHPDLQRVRTNVTDIAFAVAANAGGIALARRPATKHLETLYGLVPCLEDVAVESGASYSAELSERASKNPAAAQFMEWLAQVAVD